MEYLLAPWPWYVSGPAIALVLALLLYGGKTFGMSNNLRTLCAMTGIGKNIPFFNYNWRSKVWNLIVIGGVFIGGGIAHYFLNGNQAPPLQAEILSKLEMHGVSSAETSYMPTELFGIAALSDPAVLIILVLGGFFIGFGTRYAGGCTSGHAISGLSNLQLPSLFAVIGFFAGGLLSTHYILPVVLTWIKS